MSEEEKDIDFYFYRSCAVFHGLNLNEGHLLVAARNKRVISFLLITEQLANLLLK